VFYFLVGALHGRQHSLHLLVRHINGLQRSNHHFKLNNQAALVAGNTIRAVDMLALNSR
jgi:hypothetical protein